MNIMVEGHIEQKDENRGEAGTGPVVLFDGVCNLCNGWVRFVIDRDPKGVFRFAPLQSETAKTLLEPFDGLVGVDSIILNESGRTFVKSDAVLRIAGRLSGLWPLLSAFRIVPRFLRDWVYDLVARNRYHWFGRRDQCMIPTPEIRSRFLEQN